MLNLVYDFTASDGSVDLAAYAAFNDKEGVSFSEKPLGFKLDVFGDGHGGRLRAEFTDAEGSIQRVTLAEKVDWVGWRTLSVDLKDHPPASLKRIYMLSKEPIKGEIVLDNLTLLTADGAAASEPMTVQLTIGQTEVIVSGEQQQMDVAPLVFQERTFVPVRFIVDALGGYIDWDGAERKVSIRKGEHYIELWADQTDMIADGTRVTSDVAPLMKDGRTLLPLRFVSEHLGLNVVWDAETKGISIQNK